MQSVRDRLEEKLSYCAGQSGNGVFLKLYHESARLAADATDLRRRQGTSLGPLDGTIISFKDLFDVAGEVTMAGSKVRAKALPAAADALIVHRLRQVGCVIIGKTNMAEFAFSALGLNPHFGTPGNFADKRRIPGGSSSGAGVSVAEGSSEIAIGTDTGGSVRVPAAFNGVVGFKPTCGRVPLAGTFPLSHTLDSIGPLARTVAACAAADAVMAGEDPQPLVKASLSGLRIGLPKGLLLEGMEPAVAQGFERALQHLLVAGARLFDLSVDDLVSAMTEATKPGSIASFELSEVLADLPAEDLALLDPYTLHRLKPAMTTPAHVYIRLMQQRNTLVAAMEDRLANTDILVLPTVPITAPLMAPLVSDIALLEKTHMIVRRNTQIVNQFGLTAISLPMPNMSLPAGLMLIAKGGADHRLLSIAASVEQLRSGQ